MPIDSCRLFVILGATVLSHGCGQGVSGADEKTAPDVTGQNAADLNDRHPRHPVRLNAAEAPAPNPRLREAALSSVRSAVRAKLHWEIDPSECEVERITDKAFVPIEVTGDDTPDIAVFMANAECRFPGGTRWFRLPTNSPGGPIEIWVGANPRQKMRLRETARYFTPIANGVIFFQHGAYCDAAGPSNCVVTYRWNRDRDRFDLESKVVCDVEHPCTETEEHYQNIEPAYSGLHPDPY